MLTMNVWYSRSIQSQQNRGSSCIVAWQGQHLLCFFTSMCTVFQKLFLWHDQSIYILNIYIHTDTIEQVGCYLQRHESPIEEITNQTPMWIYVRVWHVSVGALVHVTWISSLSFFVPSVVALVVAAGFFCCLGSHLEWSTFLCSCDGWSKADYT